MAVRAGRPGQRLFPGLRGEPLHRRLLGLIPPENVLDGRGPPRPGRWPPALAAAPADPEAAARRLHRPGIFRPVVGALSRSSPAPGARVGFHTYFGEGPYRGDLLTHRVLYNPAPAHQPYLRSPGAGAGRPTRRSFPPLPGRGRRPAAARLPARQPGRRRRRAGSMPGLGVPAGARLILLNANAATCCRSANGRTSNYVELARRLLDGIPRRPGRLHRQRRRRPPGSRPWPGRSALRVRRAWPAGRRCGSSSSSTGLAEILVTNDSGPAHFAALTPIDVVALFGPETPLLFAAPGPRSHPLWAGLACSPCVNAFNNRQTACRDNVCMKAITAGQVFEAVRTIYLRRTG